MEWHWTNIPTGYTYYPNYQPDFNIQWNWWSTCPQCGVYIQWGNKYCPSCGAKLYQETQKEKIDELIEKLNAVLEELRSLSESAKTDGKQDEKD